MFELVTSMLCRILQLSIPNMHTAQLVSLFGCVAEVSVRIFFFNAYVKDGMNQMNSGKWGLKERNAFRARGRMRVMDGANDMVVEYVGSILAAAILMNLGQFGVSSFASSTAISSSTIMTLCMYQLLPEVFLDTYCTYMEVSNGLSELHKDQWSWTYASDPTSPSFLLRRGTRVRAFGAKLFATAFLTGVALCVGVNG